MINNGGGNRARRARARAIRARMAVTGESYTAAARRHDAEHDGTEVPLVLPVAQCPRCSDGVLVIDEQPRCASCGATWDDGRLAAEEYAFTVLQLDWYTSATDGAEPPAEDCPECGETAVVWDHFGPAHAGQMALCFACGESWNTRCVACNRPTLVRRPGDSLACSTCWDDAINRD